MLRVSCPIVVHRQLQGAVRQLLPDCGGCLCCQRQGCLRPQWVQGHVVHNTQPGVLCRVRGEVDVLQCMLCHGLDGGHQLRRGSQQARALSVSQPVVVWQFALGNCGPRVSSETAVRWLSHLGYAGGGECEPCPVVGLVYEGVGQHHCTRVLRAGRLQQCRPL